MAIPTAAVVRSTVREDADLMARLSEAAAATVKPGARGRIHPEVAAAFNEGRRGMHRYTVGNTTKAKAKAHAQAVKAREDLRAKGIKVGSRGRLPKGE